MSFNPSGLAIPIFLLFMACEYLFLRAKGRTLHRYNDSINSLSMGLLLLTSDALLKASTFAVFILLYSEYRILDFSTTSWITWIVFFFGVDFCYYWFHRCAHEYNILWGAHVGHHQSEEYNLTTALRQSAFQYGFSWIFYLPLAILGCPPEVFLAQFAILKMYQFWLHTQAIDKIPVLEGIFSTPSSHRVHHAKNPIYIDRNYGGTLVIWDRVFGSWQPEKIDEPCHYGTTKPLDTLSPIKANLQHWIMLARDTLATKSWSDKIKLWFMPTGWRPTDCRETRDKLQHDGCSDRGKFDPQTSRPIKIYVGVSMGMLGIFAVMYLFKSPLLTGYELLLGSASLVAGVVMINRFLENKFRFAWIEIIRVPLLLGITVQLAVAPVMNQFSQTLTIQAPAHQVFEYVTVPTKWHEWHHQSLSVVPPLETSFQKDQRFDEVIQTLLGKDDMSWNVVQHKQDLLWEAHAYNHTKDANIRLKYDLVDSNGATEFTRTLHYETPNFLLHMLNQLYFNQHMRSESWKALEALKAQLERSGRQPERL